MSLTNTIDLHVGVGPQHAGYRVYIRPMSLTVLYYLLR